jgi:hypothetical protein
VVPQRALPRRRPGADVAGADVEGREDDVRPQIVLVDVVAFTGRL